MAQQGVDLDIEPNSQRLDLEANFATGPTHGWELELISLYEVKILEGAGRKKLKQYLAADQ